MGVSTPVRKPWTRDLLRLLDLTHECFIFRDANDIITYWSQGASELYGWSSEEALGKVVHELLQCRFPEPFERIRARLRSEGAWEGELIERHRNGRLLTV